MSFENRLDEALGLGVIITDIDGTLIAIGERAAEAMRQIGIETTPEGWEEKTDALKARAKTSEEDRQKYSKFLDLFLNDALTHLDKPHRAVYDFLRQAASSTGLPIVAVSGRPEEMIKSSLGVLGGLPVTDVILKAPGQRTQKAPAYKVSEIKRKGYVPKVVLDDEPTVLDAIGREWPDAKLFRVQNGNIAPYVIPPEAPPPPT